MRQQTTPSRYKENELRTDLTVLRREYTAAKEKVDGMADLSI
jgi:hypothetical protein